MNNHFLLLLNTTGRRQRDKVFAVWCVLYCGDSSGEHFTVSTWLSLLSRVLWLCYIKWDYKHYIEFLLHTLHIYSSKCCRTQLVILHNHRIWIPFMAEIFILLWTEFICKSILFLDAIASLVVGHVSRSVTQSLREGLIRNKKKISVKFFSNSSSKGFFWGPPASPLKGSAN